MICTVASISIIIATKVATINCTDGRSLKTSVIVGATITPTPIGKFYPQVTDGKSVGFLKHHDGSWFAIHANSKALPQHGSLGCVRLPEPMFKTLAWTLDSKIVITRK
jgi:hypothetical protein